MKHLSEQKKRKGDRGLGVLISVVLTAVPVLLFYYTYLHHYPAAVFYNRGNHLFALLYTSILVLFMSVYSGYKIRKYRTRELVLSFALASLFTDFIMYVVMCLIAMKVLSPYYVVLTMLLQWCIQTILYVGARILHDRVGGRINTLYICKAENADAGIIRKFDTRRTEYEICTTVESNLSWEALCRAMDGHEAIVLGDDDPELRRRVLDYGFHHEKKILLMPEMPDVLVCNAETAVIGDALMYALHTEAPSRTYAAAKRGLDILASALALLILSPLMLVVALCIRAYDKGPAFYRQTRLTKGGREFELIKFRSMIVDAESVTGAVLAGKTDSRITPVGKFIRATRIDELPQLINILKGDMTLVGPRPERPEFYEQFCAEYPEFSYRLRVTAGLTGYAQLYGKYNTTFEDKARLDVHYIQNAGFWTDLRLLFYTLKIVFVKDSTEGVEAEDKRSTETAAMR